MVGWEDVWWEVFVRTNVAPMATAVMKMTIIVLVQHSKLLITQVTYA